MRQCGIVICIMIIVLLTIAKMPAFAETNNFGMLSLNELLNVDVISAAKLPEKMRDTAADIHVIISEDLRRSGVTSIPEALRMVPGMDVAIIAMGHSLGKKIVAEGIESEEQYHLLNNLECDEAQGYYFSHPIPVHAFAKLLALGTL